MPWLLVDTQTVPAMHPPVELHVRVQRWVPPGNIGRQTRGEAQSPSDVHGSSSCSFIDPPLVLLVLALVLMLVLAFVLLALVLVPPVLVLVFVPVLAFVLVPPVLALVPVPPCPCQNPRSRGARTARSDRTCTRAGSRARRPRSSAGTRRSCSSRRGSRC